jgi:hypothetical protein
MHLAASDDNATIEALADTSSETCDAVFATDNAWQHGSTMSANNPRATPTSSPHAACMPTSSSAAVPLCSSTVASVSTTVITREENEREGEQRKGLHLKVLGQLQHERCHYCRHKAAAAAKSSDTRHARVKLTSRRGKSCQVIVISRQARWGRRGGVESMAQARCYERDDAGFAHGLELLSNAAVAAAVNT